MRCVRSEVDAATKVGKRMILVIFKKSWNIGYFRDTFAIPEISISKPWHYA